MRVRTIVAHCSAHVSKAGLSPLPTHEIIPGKDGTTGSSFSQQSSSSFLFISRYHIALVIPIPLVPDELINTIIAITHYEGYHEQTTFSINTGSPCRTKDRHCVP